MCKRRSKFILACAFLLILNTAASEWVEIPQISSKTTRSPSDFDASSVLTTTTDIPSTTDSKSIESTQIQSTTITVDGTLTNEAFTTLKNGVQNAIIENVSTTAATYLTDIEEIDNLELNEATDEETDIEEEQYSYSGFANFIGTVQSTLMRNAHKNVKSKISVLKNLRDNLLIDIEDRMHHLMSNPSKNTRQAREYEEEGHMDFPSNEGALLTIGFLTFAVFLIKLVLKLIHVLKSKYNYYNDMTTTTMSTYFGRKKRSSDDYQDAIRILNLIDQYKFN